MNTHDSKNTQNRPSFSCGLRYVGTLTGWPMLNNAGSSFESLTWCSELDCIILWYKPKHGPSFWKFNASLVNDDDFVALINESVPLWLEEFKDVIDKMLLWDLIKHRIRQITIKYSKEKARERRRKISDIDASLKISEERSAVVHQLLRTRKSLNC